MFEWDKILIAVLGILGFAWTTYVYFDGKKGKKSEINSTENIEFYKGLREMLKEAQLINEKLTATNYNGLQTINTLTFQNERYKDKNENLETVVKEISEKIQRFQKLSEKRGLEIESLKHRERDLESEINRINEIQIERIEHESKVLIENEQLKNDIKEMKMSVRNSIDFYEEQLGQKEKQIRILTGNSVSQGKEIEKLKRILADNDITENI